MDVLNPNLYRLPYLSSSQDTHVNRLFDSLVPQGNKGYSFPKPTHVLKIEKEHKWMCERIN